MIVIHRFNHGATLLPDKISKLRTKIYLKNGILCSLYILLNGVFRCIGNSHVVRKSSRAPQIVKFNISRTWK